MFCLDKIWIDSKKIKGYYVDPPTLSSGCLYNKVVILEKNLQHSYKKSIAILKIYSLNDEAWNTLQLLLVMNFTLKVLE